MNYHGGDNRFTYATFSSKMAGDMVFLGNVSTCGKYEDLKGMKHFGQKVIRIAQLV
jgi:hypothetical protein